MTLTAARAGHSNFIAGKYLYVLGGAKTTVERALINSDGSLNTFATVSGVALGIARNQQSAAVEGSTLYVLGGLLSVGPTNTYLKTIEQATINADGSLTTFAPASSTLATGRYGQSGTSLSNRVYSFGGVNMGGGSDKDVEQADLQ